MGTAKSVGATKSASTAKSVVTTQVAVNLPALVEREGGGGGGADSCTPAIPEGTG